MGVVVRESERAPIFHHKSLCRPFQGTVGVGHDFVARQCHEVREETRVDKQSKRKAFDEGKSKMRQCIHWEMGVHWEGGEWSFPVERHNIEG